MTNFRGMQLGRLPYDSAQVARAPQLEGRFRVLAAPPWRLHRENILYQPGLDRNDVLGDCGAVGIANGARAEAALQDFSIDISTDQVVALYERFGYRPDDPKSDQGVRLLDVLTSQSQKAWLAEDQMPLTGPWATFDPQDRIMAARVMSNVGWCYSGFDLALADQEADVWDTATPASAGDSTPGSWGGHCADELYYNGLEDTDLVYLATWGKVHPATWRWIKSRKVETHAVLWRPIAGIDYERLCEDVASFAAGA